MSDPLESVVGRALERLAREGASQGDAILMEVERLEARVRGDEIDVVKQAHTKGLSLRAFVDAEGGRRNASTSTSDLSPEAVDMMVAETVALARATAVDPAAGLPEEGFAAGVPDLQLFDPADRPWKVEDRIEAAREAEQAARAVDPRITNSESSAATASFLHLTYGNTLGFLESYSGAHYGIASVPLAEGDGQKQRDYWSAASRTLDGLEDPASVGRTAGERAVGRLGARPVPTCEVPVIFEGRCAASLLMHLFACVSAYSVYRQSSFLIGRLGEEIASPAVTVIDDARLPGGLGSRPFDSEGLPTRRTAIVETGRLERFLYDTYSARKLGGASTGNAAGGAVGPSNLWLEPGDATLDELVADTSRGFLVTELMGMGFNPVTGDYSRGAAGIWIEGGRRTFPVQEVTIAGNLGDMLRSVDAVGSDLEWRSSVASPSLRVSRMTVAGE
jgi:PmbA protein